MFGNLFKKTKPIRLRFAPSPTGYLHVGNLRTVLYNYLYAKQNNGQFILRIEDTDQTRLVPGALESLLSILQNVGLVFDEGPYLQANKIAFKGDKGPYIQSERLAIYQQYAQQLIKQDKAYYCFCSNERLEQLKQQQEAAKKVTKYDGLCRHLTTDEVLRRRANNEKFVIRLKVPSGETVEFRDLIRGQIKVATTEIDDQVLLKSDGFPTYHLAVVVDDYLMKISHVVRGEEWLPSTPKHVLLYRAFNWPEPIFAHLPSLLNPDRTKLSKRQGNVAVEDYLRQGILPEALINYLALMGWHPRDNQEFFTLAELIKVFELPKIQKAGAIFDPQKLLWFNQHYLNQLSLTELASLVHNYLPTLIDPELLNKILEVQRPRLKKLDQIGELANFFLALPEYPAKSLIFKKSDNQKAKLALDLVLAGITKVEDWTVTGLATFLSNLVSENQLTNGDVFWPTRVALSGLEQSPSPQEMLWVLGREESLKRVRFALQLLLDDIHD